MPDYFLQMDQTKLYSNADIEAYPKAGEPNPIVDILHLRRGDEDRPSRSTFGTGNLSTMLSSGTTSITSHGRPTARELLFNRTNRRQNVLELAACDPATGKCRVVVRDEWPPSWVENNPEMRFLKDGKRFIWLSRANGLEELLSL